MGDASVYLCLALVEVARADLSNDVVEVGSVPLVQALALIWVYLRRRYKSNFSYNYLGHAS
ncbi:hypothetical protein BDV12DRAFT_181395 [Aspergillus spectabilis]